jgi:hypothetical protein
MKQGSGYNSGLIFNFFIQYSITIGNHEDNIIDFLRLPRPQGERRTESRLRDELGVAKINLLPLGLGYIN